MTVIDINKTNTIRRQNIKYCRSVSEITTVIKNKTGTKNFPMCCKIFSFCFVMLMILYIFCHAFLVRFFCCRCIALASVNSLKFHQSVRSLAKAFLKKRLLLLLAGVKIFSQENQLIFAS